MSTFGFKT
jgi:hypothetical protein